MCELAETHRHSLLLNFAIQSMSTNGYQSDIASLATAATYFPVFNNVLQSTLLRAIAMDEEQLQAVLPDLTVSPAVHTLRFGVIHSPKHSHRSIRTRMRVLSLWRTPSFNPFCTCANTHTHTYTHTCTIHARHSITRFLMAAQSLCTHTLHTYLYALSLLRKLELRGGEKATRLRRLYQELQSAAALT